MQKILEQLYTGGLHPGEGRYISAPAYRELVRNINSMEEQFCSTLTDEQKVLWEGLSEQKETRDFTETMQVFIDGFRLGGRIMLECMEE